MQKQGKKKILAVVDDLMFRVKINEAAKRAGMDVEFLKAEKDVLEGASHKPALVLLDLNCGSVEPLRLIGKLKGDGATRDISLIGYVSHVQGELKQQAQEAGCDLVMARSAFSTNLHQILKRHSGTL